MKCNTNEVVGLVELEVGEIRVNFYATHLHAEYDRENDLYLPHRTSQSFELSQFIRHTAHGADVVIVTGDFNMEPDDLGFRLILSQARLLDAWRLANPSTPSDNVSTRSFSQCRGVDRGGTCDRPDNCYSSQRFKEHDESKRIDYILFKNGRMSITLKKCEIAMNKIPDENINYSDHVGLQAHFIIEKEQRQQSCEWEPNRPLLIEAIGIVSGGQRRARGDRTWFVCGAVLLFVVIALSLLLDPMLPFMSILLSVFRFALTVVLAFCVWQGVIGLTLERSLRLSLIISKMNFLVHDLGDELDDRPPPTAIHVAPFREDSPEFMAFGTHAQRAAVISAGVGLSLVIFIFLSIFFEFDWYHHEKGVDIGALISIQGNSRKQRKFGVRNHIVVLSYLKTMPPQSSSVRGYLLVTAMFVVAMGIQAVMLTSVIRYFRKNISL
ncbi:hypothetical protein ANCCAN_09805 [Ancylostoma caninum]|uniref:sphingomyelin phosphodiesterase n=1 Tax=Ancylostoma caninum TaxID=29170 RepID=A0A368GIN1_ANCCA|nr:hypothetical protein ANCCAN_09805 [Ancylostoma caninum]